MGSAGIMSGLKTVNDCFLEGCREKNPEKVKAAIFLGCDVNCQDDAKNNNNTGLMHSAGEYFNLEIMNLILQHPDVNVNKQTAFAGYNCAIHDACCYKNPLAVARLGAVPGLDGNIQEPTGGQTALHCAVQEKSVECVTELLKIPGINVNIKNNA